MFSNEDLYDYFDFVRAYSLLDSSLVEDICVVVLDYHKCGCRDRLYKIEEIMEYVDSCSSDYFADVYFRRGIDVGVDVVGSIARLLFYKRFNDVYICDVSLIPGDIDVDKFVSEWVDRCRSMGISIVDSSSGSMGVKSSLEVFKN